MAALKFRIALGWAYLAKTMPEGKPKEKKEVNITSRTLIIGPLRHYFQKDSITTERVL